MLGVLRFQASAVAQIRSVLILDFTQCRMSFSYRHFRASQSQYHRSSNPRSMLGTLRYAIYMRTEVFLTFFSDCLTLEGGSHSFSRNVGSGVKPLTAQISNAEGLILVYSKVPLVVPACNLWAFH